MTDGVLDLMKVKLFTLQRIYSQLFYSSLSSMKFRCFLFFCPILASLGLTLNDYAVFVTATLFVNILQTIDQVGK